jgi:hypothetical protein
MVTMAEKKDTSTDRDIKQDLFYHGVFDLKDTPKLVPSELKSEHPEPKKIVVEPSKDIRSELEADRKKWTATILDMANKFKDMAKMTELQVELYSNRQIVLEHSHYLQSLLARVTKNYRKAVGSKTSEYITGVAKDADGRKLKMGETNALVEASTADNKEHIELLESQIDFLHDTKKNIDNMIFGLGHRIQFDEYRRTS